MESAIGRISALDETVATVVIESPVACKRCAAGKGCGAGIFQSSDRKREIQIRIPVGMSLREGDPVELTIGPKFLLRAAMLAYGLPLIGMVAFPALARMVSGNNDDGPGIVLAILGLVVGLGIGHRMLSRASTCEQFVPSIGRVSDGQFG
jgi:sigma-E factor negative regulatory protein RseC